jgi:hypothetical protein
LKIDHLLCNFSCFHRVVPPNNLSGFWYLIKLA